MAVIPSEVGKPTLKEAIDDRNTIILKFRPGIV